MSETHAHTNGSNGARARRLPVFSARARATREGSHLSDHERRIAITLVEALFPGGGRFLPRGDDSTVRKVEELFAQFGADAAKHWGALLKTLEHAARFVPSSRGRAFSELHEYERARLLGAWSDASDVARRTLILALTAPLKVAYFDDEMIYRALGAPHRFHSQPERPRYMERVTRAQDLTEDVELECDAVVVGTGAGGAVVAKELAQKGFAVLILEEGEFHQRSEFTGGLVESVTRFYRERGTIGSIGNTVVVLPMGRMVGGSTAINTGTCWRTPEWILNRWTKDGLPLTPDAMAPYFDRVWSDLGIARADWKYLGGAARVVARGCDALGYSHRPVDRNAPDCDGSGICDAGCPTDARRSTNVSYIPMALRAGAELFTGVRVESLVRDGGRIAGVVGRTARGKKITARARASVLACGTLMTPLLLEREGIHRRLSHVGKNLSVHPATIVSALFDEDIRGYNAIPQGYCVDELQRSHGVLMLGASAPIDVGASQFTFVGDKLVSTMERYDRIASMGVMVSDDSRGSVKPGPRGRPMIYYWVGKKERARLTKGIAAMTRIFLAAGAHEVYPAVHGHRIVGDARALSRLERADLSASDFTLMGFHPLGTARMATTPSRGVVDFDHQVFGHEGLFVADGSVVPSSVAVNPQVTIMAMSARAADRIAQKLA